MKYQSTYNEELLDGESRSIRIKHREINDELSKYSWKTIRKFEQTFPCSQKISDNIMEVFPKEYIEEQEAIKEKMKTSQSYFEEGYTQEYIYIISPEDFWTRWNRFKMLKVFL